MLDWSRDGADWPNRELSAFVETRHNRWHVQRGGSGTGLLLLHGAGAATHTWRDLIPLLLQHFAILAPDLPGQGFTTGEARRYTLPGMTAGLKDLLAAEAFVPEIVVGHSAGGAIALRYAIDAATPPRHVICLNGALTPFRGVAGLLFPSLAKLLSLNPLTGALFSRTARAPGAVRNLIEGTGSAIDARGLGLYRRLVTDPGHVSATLGMMARWELEPLLADLPRLTSCVTLVLGGRDRAVPPAGTRAIAPAIPRARLISYDDLGHLIHEEAPETIAKLIAQVSSDPGCS